MLKIECCGLSSAQTKQIIEKNFADKVEALAGPDMVAARRVKAGETDYYLGSCMTGAGGSLATAIMVLGYSNCLVVSRQGKCPSAKEIRHMVYAGKHKAFGYVKEHTELVVPAVVQALVDRADGKPE